MEVQLLVVSPGLTHDLGRALGSGQALDAGVGLELSQTIAMDGRTWRPGRDGDEVPVPGAELLEPFEDVLALGAERRALEALLELAGRELEILELGLQRGPCRIGTLAGQVEQA